MPAQDQTRPEEDIEMFFSPEQASVSFPQLTLDVEHPKSSGIHVSVEKHPTEVVEGKTYCSCAVLVDRESEYMKRLAAEAGTLTNVPESERPAKVLEVFRRHMSYAYDDVVEQLSTTEPERAEWIRTHAGLSSRASEVPLSKIFENGYGVCRHLSTAYLWLAQKAGMKGVIQSSEFGVIKNIMRSDTGEKLFRSTDVGASVPAHVWVELQTSDGKWIPVDPSTNLVGDADEKLTMFREANYQALGGVGLTSDTEPKAELDTKSTAILFAPAEPTASGTYSLELRSAKPTIRIGTNLPPDNTPYSGPGTLHISRDTRFNDFALSITGLEKEKDDLKAG